MSRAAVIKCFAKINLFLDVVCKRADGYHNIETIFQTISLNDVMELELTPSEMEVTCDDPTVPTDRSNLALKAFLRLKEATGCKGGVRIKIKKNIPPGSGLGGGSSNAAAALVALNRMLGGGLSEEQLRGIARDFGADVPFFISGGLAAAFDLTVDGEDDVFVTGVGGGYLLDRDATGNFTGSASGFEAQGFSTEATFVGGTNPFEGGAGYDGGHLTYVPEFVSADLADVTTVPEPATLALLAGGLLPALLARRARRPSRKR